MKIAFLPSTYFPFIGGMEVQTHTIANSLVKDQNQIDIFLLNKNNIKSKYKIKILNKYIINIVFYFHYYLRINFSFLLKIYLKKFINIYDVWHFQSINYKTLIILNSLKELNEKIFITFHGADIQIDNKIKYGYRLNKKYNKYLKSSIKNFDLVHAISSTMEKDLIKLGINKNKICRMPNVVNFDKINRLKIKKKLNKKIKLLVVARYAKLKKGYDLIPKLSKELIKLNVKFEWNIIGNGTENLYLDNFVTNNRDKFKIYSEIIDRNELDFPATKLIKIYKNSDIYVNLARIESFGVTIIEAMASGLPIISFNTTGANETVINNFNGIIINIRNFKLMASAIKKLFLDKNRLVKFAKNSIILSKNYDINKIRKDLKRNYKILLK